MDEQRRCLNCMREYDASAGKCPHCGFQEEQPSAGYFLPPRTILNQRYFIGRALRANSESITYIAYDLKIDTKVCIREYLPVTLSARAEDGQVKPLPGREANYKALMSDFSELTLCLSKLRTFQSVAQVYELFAENGTVYAVCEYVDGMPLSDYLNRQKGNLRWEAVRKLILPMLEALAVVHTARVYHRGISPETVYLTKKGELKLDGFAISPLRAVRTELNPQLYAGYAAPEQYLVSSWHGPWTDVYAVSALLYRLLTGVTPPSAADRVRQDTLEPIQTLRPDLPAGVASAIMTGLRIQPESRQQSVRVLMDGLSGGGEPAPIPQEEPKPEPVIAVKPEKKKRRHGRFFALSISCISVLLLALVAAIVYGAIFNPDVFAVFHPTSSTEYVSSAVSESVSLPFEISSTVSSEDTSEDTRYSMPNLVGKTKDEILNDATYTGWFDITWIEDYDNAFEKGVVCKQDKLYGSRFHPVQKLTLTISLGSSRITLPEYVGLSEGDYIAELTGLGIDDAHYTVSYVKSEDVPAGWVVCLDNVSEGLLADGSTFDFRGDQVITIYVSMPE